MAKHAMPVSKAKTAYGLLSEIRALILEEPKRYDQRDYISRGLDAQMIYGPLTPKCGTVGCVAGWTEVLKPGNWSENTLGVTESQQEELFASELAGERPSTLAGVRAHARRGERLIARFQKKYAKQLKAKRV